MGLVGVDGWDVRESGQTHFKQKIGKAAVRVLYGGRLRPPTVLP